GRVAEGRLLRAGVVIPAVQGCQVHWGELPLADRVHLADREAGALLLLGHGEPQLGQGDAGTHDHVLEHRDFAHELGVLRVGAEAHDALDAGAVVPGAVEEDDLATGREVLGVALEVPAGGLAFGRLLQGDGAGTTRGGPRVEAGAGAGLAGGVAALEEDDVFLAGVRGPGLPLQQLGLEGALDVLVLIATHALFVGVVLTPGIDALAVWGDQYRVVFIAVIHHVPLGGCEVDEVHVFFVGIAHAVHLFSA